MPTSATTSGSGARRTRRSGCAGARASALSERQPSVSIEIANESGVDVDEADLAALARHVLDGMRMHPLAELSVLLVDRGTMADLHERGRAEPAPTDVLSFPMDELRPPPPGNGARGGDQGAGGEPTSPPGLLGDVVLCPEVASDQASQAHHPLRDELEL